MAKAKAEANAKLSLLRRGVCLTLVCHSFSASCRKSFSISLHFYLVRVCLRLRTLFAGGKEPFKLIRAFSAIFPSKDSDVTTINAGINKRPATNRTVRQSIVRLEVDANLFLFMASVWMAPGVYQSRFCDRCDALPIEFDFNFSADCNRGHKSVLAPRWRRQQKLLLHRWHRQRPHVTAIWLLAPGAQY